MFYQQNWEGVAPPAIPSDWNVDAQYATSSGTGYGSSNSLAISDNGGVYRWATYGTSDSTNGYSGNILTYFSFGTSGVNNTWQYGLTYRCNAATMNNSSTRCYYARLNDNPGLGTATFSLGTINNGTYTNITSVSINIGTLTGAGWYEILVQLNNTRHQLALLNIVAGTYLNSSGNFVSTFSYAIDQTDSTYTSGNYYGVATKCPVNTVSVYYDVYQINTSPLIVPLTKSIVVRTPRQFYTEDYG